MTYARPASYRWGTSCISCVRICTRHRLWPRRRSPGDDHPARRSSDSTCAKPRRSRPCRFSPATQEPNRSQGRMSRSRFIWPAVRHGRPLALFRGFVCLRRFGYDQCCLLASGRANNSKRDRGHRQEIRNSIRARSRSSRVTTFECSHFCGKLLRCRHFTQSGLGTRGQLVRIRQQQADLPNLGIGQ